MKWEYELMRELLERAREYENVNTFECMKSAAMLRQAANVMTHWDRRIIQAEAWAAKLEVQMRREGWSQEDLDELQRG